MTHPTILNRFCRFAAVPLCLAALAITRAAADVPTPTQVAICLSCHGNGMERPPARRSPSSPASNMIICWPRSPPIATATGTAATAADMQTFAKQLKPSDLPIAARFFADLREMKW